MFSVHQNCSATHYESVEIISQGGETYIYTWSLHYNAEIERVKLFTYLPIIATTWIANAYLIIQLLTNKVAQ